MGGARTIRYKPVERIEHHPNPSTVYVNSEHREEGLDRVPRGLQAYAEYTWCIGSMGLRIADHLKRIRGDKFVLASKHTLRSKALSDDP